MSEPKKFSEVWKFFSLVEGPDKKTKCSLCATVLSYKSNSTKTMWNHLKAVHAGAMTENRDTVRQKYGPRQQSIIDFGKPKMFSAEKMEKCYRKAAVVCAMDLRPFSMFQSPAYRAYMAEVQPSYKPPVAKTVKKHLSLQYIEEKAQLKEKLQHQAAVGITSDLWTSLATHSYITCTAHYITSDWELKHCVLGTRRLEDRHTGDNIQQAIHIIASEYGIQDKIDAITTDNASNMAVAAKTLHFTTENHGHVNCFAHTMQLAVEDGPKLPQIEEAAIASQHLVGHFNRSTLASDALESYQRRQGTKPIKLIQDVATRWNSTYFMFERLTKLRSAVYAVIHDSKITSASEARRLELRDEMWRTMETMIPVLSPLVDATEALSSEEYPTISGVTPMLILLMKYDLAVENDDQLVKDFKDKVRCGLQRRFTTPCDPDFEGNVAAVASLLDPRHKSLHFLDDVEMRGRLKDTVLNLLATDSDPSTATPQEDDADMEPPRKRRSVLAYLEGDVYQMEPQSSQLEGPAAELQAYISEPVHIKHPLTWWKHYEGRFPALAKLARRFLCIMGTSVPAERVFSVAGLTVTKSRAALDPDTVDMLIFMNKILQKKPLQAAAAPSVSQSVCVKQEMDTAAPVPGDTTNDGDGSEDEDLPPMPALY